MIQAKTVKISTKLREITNWWAVLQKETRWTGNFEMVKQVFKIENQIQSISILDVYLPTPPHRQALEKAFPPFQNFKVLMSIFKSTIY